jgi:3-oxoadipate enol-lactonase
MQFERISDITVLFTQQGNSAGTPLVFANSLGTDFRIWDELLILLGDDYRVLRYDKRGHGLSDLGSGSYTIDLLATDLAALLDHLETGPAVVCGLSVGGMIAQRLAAQRPDLVRALVLCNTAHRMGTPDMWEQRIDAIRAGGIESLAEPILERWFSAEYRRERTAELAGWRNMLVRTPVEGYLATCAAIRDADLSESTSKLQLPTLCVAGSVDGAAPPELVRTMAKMIEGARYLEIEGVGHMPCIEAPDALTAAMQAFFAEAKVV